MIHKRKDHAHDNPEKAEAQVLQQRPRHRDDRRGHEAGIAIAYLPISAL